MSQGYHLAQGQAVPGQFVFTEYLLCARHIKPTRGRYYYYPRLTDEETEAWRVV